MRLLDESVPGITVIRGDGNWTALGGEPFDPLACGRQNLLFADYCTPGIPPVIGESDTGYAATPFGNQVRQLFRTMCTPDEAEAALTKAARESEEHRLGQVLWNGDQAIIDGWAGEMYFESPLVATSGSELTVEASIGTLLSEAGNANPDLQPILHLGVEAALKIGRDVRVLDIPWIVNTGYPPAGIAVSGPITFRIGSVQVLNRVDESINRRYIEGYYSAAISFDPCLARRSGTTTS